MNEFSDLKAVVAINEIDRNSRLHVPLVGGSEDSGYQWSPPLDRHVLSLPLESTATKCRASPTLPRMKRTSEAQAWLTATGRQRVGSRGVPPGGKYRGIPGSFG